MVDTKLITDKHDWESFLLSHPEANFLQSWYWGEFHTRLGKKIQRTGFFRDGKLIGVMLSVVENAKRGRYLTVPGGPILDWHDEECVGACVQAIKSIAQETSCVFVRVRPQLVSDDFSKAIFKKHGFISAPTHLHAELTHQLDITKPSDVLLQNMRKATRYEIKKAQKLGIKIHTSQKTEDIQSFYDLQLETAKRQKFVPFSYTFLAEQFEVFAQAKLAVLYTAEFENTILAQAFLIFYGKEAVYHYGASTDMGRKYPGAYLIQWEAILEAQKRKMERYNFWGVSPLNNTDHRFSGLSLFKRGFAGEDVEYLHAQDLVVNKPRYVVNAVIEYVRKKVRRT